MKHLVLSLAMMASSSAMALHFVCWTESGELALGFSGKSAIKAESPDECPALCEEVHPGTVCHAADAEPID